MVKPPRPPGGRPAATAQVQNPSAWPPASNGNAQNGHLRCNAVFCSDPALGLQSGQPAGLHPGTIQEHAMGEPSPVTPQSEDRLDSWKAIAAYLGRDVTTVQRWEKRETMPVHRHVHDKRGSVYALAPELDAWLESRRRHLGEEQEDKEKEPEPPLKAEGEPEADRQRRPTLPARGWLALAAVAVLVVLAGAYMASRGRAGGGPQPKIRSLAVLPLKNLSGDPAQEYLADGMTEALIGRLSTM